MFLYKTPIKNEYLLLPMDTYVLWDVGAPTTLIKVHSMIWGGVGLRFNCHDHKTPHPQCTKEKFIKFMIKPT